MPSHSKHYEAAEFPLRVRNRWSQLGVPESSVRMWGSATLRAYHRPTLGVIGTRRPSRAGLEVVETLIGALTTWKEPPLVVSGGAFGIDRRAHWCALKLGLPTHAWVVGPGSSPGPKGSDSLFDVLRANPIGGWCVPQILEPSSQNPIRPRWWLARNAYMVACCDALIVAEAHENSGTWATVRMANEIGIPVFAAPTNFHNLHGRGTNQMIANAYADPIVGIKELMASLVERLLPSSYT